MFIIDVIKSLSKSELNLLDLKINAHRRVELKKLYKKTKKYKTTNTIPSKKELFESSFNDIYTKEKDYKLRRELKLLRDIIKSFLVEEEMRLDASQFPEVKNYYFLKSLYRNNLLAHFEKNMNKLKEESKNSIYPFYRNQILFMIHRFLCDNQSWNMKSINLMNMNLDELKLGIHKETLYQFRLLESELNYVKHYDVYIINFNDLEESKEKSEYIDFINLNQPGLEDDYAKFLRLTSMSRFSRGIQTIEINKEILRTLANIKLSGFNTNKKIVAYLGNLVVAYAKVEDFRKAEEYSLELINFCIKNNIEQLSSTFINLTDIYVNLAEYQKGIDTINRYDDTLKHLANYNVLRIYKSFCYLFLKESKLAIQEIASHTEGLFDYYKIVHRIIYAISFFIDTEYELAFNEIKNARVVVRSKKSDNYSFFDKELRILHDFFKWKTEPAISNNDILKKLSFDIDHYLESNPTDEKELYIIWLIKSIEEELAN